MPHIRCNNRVDGAIHRGGERKFVAALARAACAVGVAGLFIETHQDPDNAPCDGPNMIQIGDMPALIAQLRDFDALRKGR